MWRTAIDSRSLRQAYNLDWDVFNWILYSNTGHIIITFSVTTVFFVPFHTGQKPHQQPRTSAVCFQMFPLYGLTINSVYQYVVAHSLVSSMTRPSQCSSVICVFDMTSLCMGGDGLPCETVWVVLWEVSSTGKSFRKSGDTLDDMVFTIGHYTWLMKTMAVCVPCVGRGF